MPELFATIILFSISVSVYAHTFAWVTAKLHLQFNFTQLLSPWLLLSLCLVLSLCLCFAVAATCSRRLKVHSFFVLFDLAHLQLVSHTRLHQPSTAGGISTSSLCGHLHVKVSGNCNSSSTTFRFYINQLLPTVTFSQVL